MRRAATSSDDGLFCSLAEHCTTTRVIVTAQTHRQPASVLSTFDPFDITSCISQALCTPLLTAGNPPPVDELSALSDASQSDPMMVCVMQYTITLRLENTSLFMKIYTPVQRL